MYELGMQVVVFIKRTFSHQSMHCDLFDYKLVIYLVGKKLKLAQMRLKSNILS